MKTLVFVIIFISFELKGISQTPTIQVNPDGTHTVIFDFGSNSIQVNPDGTHSVIFHHESISTQVNADGTHTSIFHNGNTSTKVNPDGTHTIVFHNGSTTIQVHQDGSHSVIIPGLPANVQPDWPKSGIEFIDLNERVLLKQKKKLSCKNKHGN